MHGTERRRVQVGGREHGDRTAVVDLARGVHDQFLQFVRPGLAPAQPEQPLQRDEGLPAGTAFHTTERQFRRAQVRADPLGEVAVERPASPTVTDRPPRPLNRRRIKFFWANLRTWRKSGKMPSTGTNPTTLSPKCRAKSAAPAGKTAYSRYLIIAHLLLLCCFLSLP